MDLPDLTAYELHRVVEDAEFEGVPVPGLRATFYRRADGGRVATVGHYHLGRQELLLAWGYVDEEHCRFSAVREPAGAWHPPVAGCPTIRLVHVEDRAGEPVIGLAVQTPAGHWIDVRSAEADDREPNLEEPPTAPARGGFGLVG